jgi:hypothetical protein
MSNERQAESSISLVGVVATGSGCRIIAGLVTPRGYRVNRRGAVFASYFAAQRQAG